VERPLKADFNDRAGGRRTRGEQPEESSFVLAKMAGNQPSFFPRLVKHGKQVAGNQCGGHAVPCRLVLIVAVITERLSLLNM
jgi:hypothetical protein